MPPIIIPSLSAIFVVYNTYIYVMSVESYNSTRTPFYNKTGYHQYQQTDSVSLK